MELGDEEALKLVHKAESIFLGNVTRVTHPGILSKDSDGHP